MILKFNSIKLFLKIIHFLFKFQINHQDFASFNVKIMYFNKIIIFDFNPLIHELYFYNINFTYRIIIFLVFFQINH
jgi:hypothetical protein